MASGVDRMVVSDESASNSPNRYMNLVSLRAWLQDTFSLAADKITAGVISVARLGTGTANDTKVLYGDGAWKDAPTGSGGGSSTTSVNQVSNTAIATVELDFGSTNFHDITDMIAWPANATALCWNGGRSANDAASAYAGEWHKLHKSQWDRLANGVADAGDSATQANCVLYREFIDPPCYYCGWRYS